MALVVEAVGQACCLKPCPISGPECLPGLLLGGPDRSDLPGTCVIAPMVVSVGLAVLKMVGPARIPKQRLMSGPGCLPKLLLGRHGGQEMPDTYAISPVEVGEAVVVEVVARARVSSQCPTSGPECSPGLLLGGPGGEETSESPPGLAGRLGGMSGATRNKRNGARAGSTAAGPREMLLRPGHGAGFVRGGPLGPGIRWNIPGEHPQHGLERPTTAPGGPGRAPLGPLKRRRGGAGWPRF